MARWRVLNTEHARLLDGKVEVELKIYQAGRSAGQFLHDGGGQKRTFVLILLRAGCESNHREGLEGA
jgi:hypothetical protein